MKKKKLLYVLSLFLIVAIPFAIVFGKAKKLDFSFLAKLKGSPASVVEGEYRYNNVSFDIKDIWGESSTPSFYLGPNEHEGILKHQYIHEAQANGKYYHAYCIDRGIAIEDTGSPYLTSYIYNNNFEGLISRDINGNDTGNLTQNQIDTLQDILSSGYHYSPDHTLSIDSIKDKTTKEKIFVKQILVWEVMAGGRDNLDEVPEACNTMSLFIDGQPTVPIGKINCAYAVIISQKANLLKYYREELEAARKYRSKRTGSNEYAPIFFKDYSMRWNNSIGKYTTGVISNELGGFTSNCRSDNPKVSISVSGDHATVTSTEPIASATINCDYVVGSGSNQWNYYDFPDHPGWQRIVNGEGGTVITASFTVRTEEAKLYISKFNPDNRQVYGSKFKLTLKSDPSVSFTITGNGGVVAPDIPDEGTAVLAKSGIYILSEIVAPHGYQKISDTELNIDLNTRSITSSNTSEVQAAFNDITHAFEVRVLDNFSAFNLYKVNDKNEQLKGATFKIYKGSNFNEEVKFTKNNNVFSYSPSGTVTEIVDPNYSSYAIRFLDKGIYKVEETKAPTPYILPTEISDRTFYIKVETDYKIFDCGKDSTCKNASLTVNNGKTIKNYRTKIEIIKTGQAGVPLQGVKFVLLNENKTNYITATSGYNYSGTTSDISAATVFITGANGSFVINNVPSGTYYLKEIETIDPYVLPEGDDAYTKLVVEVTVDGPRLNNKAALVESISNATKEFNFYKVDENGNYLSGGKFKIQRFNDDTGKYVDVKITSVENDGSYMRNANVFKEDDEDGKVQFTLSHGIATFVDMKPGSTYRIVELEAPKGYEVTNVENSAIIKLDRKGYAKGSATIINQMKKVEGSTAQAELIIEIQTGRKLIRYGLIIAGTLIIIFGLMGVLIYITKKRK